MELWQFIHTKVKEDKTVFLLCVMQHQGSSPGRQGFKMAVASDQSISGSIGGGIMEYNLVEECKSRLAAGNTTPFAKHQIHKGTIVNGSGMICSGEQTVLFYPLGRENIGLLTKIIAAYENGDKGILVIHPNRINFEITQFVYRKFAYEFKSESEWLYEELLNHRSTVYIFGAGHVGLASSKLLTQLGYYVVLFDNREELNTYEENSFAHVKKLVNYTNITPYLEDRHGIILIMTNKYTDDKLVLSQCIRQPHQFLGVLGSTAKLEVMFDVLGKEGFSAEELSKVHAPIGLPIRSQTPDEIAVSIAAQLISLRTLIHSQELNP